MGRPFLPIGRTAPRLFATELGERAALSIFHGLPPFFAVGDDSSPPPPTPPAVWGYFEKGGVSAPKHLLQCRVIHQGLAVTQWRNIKKIQHSLLESSLIAHLDPCGRGLMNGAPVMVIPWVGSSQDSFKRRVNGAKATRHLACFTDHIQSRQRMTPTG